MVLNAISIALGEYARDCVRRSRFSFRFDTPHRKRWLLVQLVSVEVSEGEEKVTRTPARRQGSCGSWNENYWRLLKQYEEGSLISRR